MSYITAADIKSNLAQGFNLIDYLSEADSEITDLAERLGVRDSDKIYITPLHYKIKRYGIVFVLMRLAQDKIGSNSPDVALEKYRDLYEMYRRELKELVPQITYEMFTNDIDSIIGRTQVFNLYRA
jgi:hypothetical protein